MYSNIVHLIYPDACCVELALVHLECDYPDPEHMYDRNPPLRSPQRNNYGLYLFVYLKFTPALARTSTNAHTSLRFLQAFVKGRFLPRWRWRWRWR